MEQLDLNQIRTFVKLVQAGSFTKAAEVLHQPKSRVSRRLAALERDLGIQLVYRTTRQFQLTDAGRAYYERSRGLVEGLESISAELSEEVADVSGWLKVTASDDMGVLNLPDIFADFAKQHPRVRFELLLSQAYVDLVKESVDVAVRIGILKDSNLRVKRVATLKSIIIASPGFMERYRQADDFENISTLPFLTMNSQNKLEVWRISDGKKMTVKVDPVMTANNPNMIVQMAIHGRGIAMVPEFIAAEHIRAGRLVQIHRGFRGQEIPISLVSPEQKEIPMKTKKFIDFAAKRLKEKFENF
ncbi:LysR family transcriptional regulator [Bdellovibrio sp. SKB1291214]|uniref:LysR family transcriptional regulator n=1 Tax=Bdellovibrio sp. SKB1291214 TaxID=1732569 RepID=UPI000B51CFF0|nr:LysR family transcriptional regulator [Bdellovibrio sp. SKB1291214]UYL09796.1 LysR family transcriptional regulator [Bdellovibrio sp. SKB1291214]